MYTFKQFRKSQSTKYQEGGLGNYGKGVLRCFQYPSLKNVFPKGTKTAIFENTEARSTRRELLKILKKTPRGIFNP